MWTETQFLEWINRNSLSKCPMTLEDISGLTLQLPFPEKDGGYLFVSSRTFNIQTGDQLNEERLWSYRGANSQWELGHEYQDYTSWDNIAEPLLQKCEQIDPYCRMIVEREQLQNKYNTHKEQYASKAL